MQPILTERLPVTMTRTNDRTIQRWVSPRGLRGVARSCAMVGVMVGAAACGGAGDGPSADASEASPLPSDGSNRLFGSPVEPGVLALDYVTAGRYPALLIEADFVEGFAPSDEALEHVEAVLRARLQKPYGIGFDLNLGRPIPAELVRDEYGEHDIEAIESAVREHWTGDARNASRAVIWVAFLNGRSDRANAADEALGIALGGSQIALFPSAIGRSVGHDADSLPAASALAFLHEIGHLLGLVNNGVPQVDDHEDAASPFHCATPGCVMGSRFDDLLGSDGATLDYCSDCRVDLHAVGGPDPERLPGALPTFSGRVEIFRQP